MPIVYTYFHPLPAMNHGIEQSLIIQWQKSWRASEFVPVTLTHQMAEAHPKATEFIQKVKQFPSVNPPGYDLACWMRWLALAQAGGGLMTDYDVIARAFSVDFLAIPHDVAVLDRGGVPCAVQTTAEGAQQIVQDILSFSHKHDGTHYSDMLFVQARGYHKEPTLTAPFGAPDWKEAPAVHFSHTDCARERPGKSRHSIVKTEMSL